ncbi:MAG: VOC family protein [Pseudomonadota bacterium]
MNIDDAVRLPLDHLMICASDWRVGRNLYERLGFTLTPLRKNAPMGGSDGAEGGSQLIMLGGGNGEILNYLEISTAVPESAAPLMRRILNHDGPAMMVHFSEQITKVSEAWADLGVNVHRFEAAFPSSGSLGGGRFEIAVADPRSVPLQLNVVHSEDRNGYLDPDWQAHKNGALAWRDVYCVIPDAKFDSVVKRHSQLVSIEPVVDECEAIFDAGPVDIRLLTASKAEIVWQAIRFESRANPYIAGLRITVRDLSALEGLLLSSGINYAHGNEEILIGPQEAVGGVIVFSEEIS